MDFIQDWVAQIIIFLLIAMFIDLLLPQSAMQKYVKFAIGLILVLIFLQPLFQLFNTDASRLVENSLSISENELDEIKNQIENEKSEIQASQRAYILNQTVVQLKEQAEGELIDKYGVAIKDITFTFLEENEELNWENVESLSVELMKEELSNGGSEVENVVIDFNQESTDEDLPLEQIQDDLASFWEISKNKINLIWEGGETT
ncbi:stage III sporulation protein AF [Salirhabdus sp. Marseille-P4669]|uniref:stage III sporulation protein AF n=1 Tax=Salirhabdus sp. Marseille-P4669 TaxID=2042310 RepID=UPI000C7C3AD8|nr:stage III sporulation protein AF [Salirhabdus sp. Marseille-P4669]